MRLLGWEAWQARNNSGYQVSSVWEEVYGETEYHPVPVEKPFGTDRKDLVAVGIRR